MNQKGFSNVVIITMIGAILALGGTYAAFKYTDPQSLSGLEKEYSSLLTIFSRKQNKLVPKKTVPKTKRDDFGCFSSCTNSPVGFPNQKCDNWKTGKAVQWPSDCSLLSHYPGCVKLCGVENKANLKPSGGSSQQNNKKQPAQQSSGIPKEDPGAENVYIYFTDFKHNRIIRIEDMTGKGWISFGTLGNGINQFNNPNHFFVQPDGRIYIADTLNHRIVRIDDMTGKGWVSYGSQGIRSVGHFQNPSSVLLDKQGRIYVVDDGNCRIVRMDDMTGAGWTEYGRGAGDSCGQPATEPGELNGPKDIAFDSQGRIYISDDFDQRIVRINDLTGAGWVTYGTKGTGVGQFLQPQSVTIDGQDRIYVSDEDKNTQGGYIVRMDDMSGKGWITFPSIGPDPRIRLPHDIKLTASGYIYIANTRNNGITRMDDLTGKGLTSYAPCGECQQGTDPHQLEAPKGIFILEKK